MDKYLQQFMNMDFKSKATIINQKIVEVTDQDGEIFSVWCGIGKYIEPKTRNYHLHLLEYIFDKHYSQDKEIMLNNIWRETYLTGLTVLGISSGNRQRERLRIGKRIREIREGRGIEARDLAKLAGLDAANLSKIENGKLSVGLDILSRIAAVFGKKIDFVDIEF